MTGESGGQRPERKGGPGGGRPRRRRRPGKPPRAGPEPGRSPAAPTLPPGAAALEESRIDSSRPPDESLAPAEVEEMREHLAFLRKHRKLLRLKVNAAEDLLLNGVREPNHRGVCLHLLSKVDLACVESSLSRLGEDHLARIDLLEGVVRFSADAGVLLLYLEELQRLSSRAEAAAAFGRAVERIDFGGISPARMRRILELIAATFTPQERIEVVFGLLQSGSFRDAFDRSTEALPGELADLFAPLRAVHDVVLRGRRGPVDEEALSRGVEMMLRTSEAALQRYPLPVRIRLLDQALGTAAGRTGRAADALLESLPHAERSWSRLAMLRARALLADGRDEPAQALLSKVVKAHPDFQQPARWLEALRAPRIGRFAVTGERRPGRSRRAGRDEREAREASAGSRLVEGFWLARQRPVWLQVGDEGEAEHLEAAAALQAEEPVMGLLPVIEVARGESGIAIAYPAVGVPAALYLARRRPGCVELLAIAWQGVQLLRSLGLAGIELVDTALRRFVIVEAPIPGLMLASLDGARRTDADVAVAAHTRLAPDFCRTLLGRLPPRDRPRELLEHLGEEHDLGELVRALARESPG